MGKRIEVNPLRPLISHLGASDKLLLHCKLPSPRFYDFNVWSKKKVREKLDYKHTNPVARKLVDHPKDWPWSSWSFYAKGEAGLVRIDAIG